MTDMQPAPGIITDKPEIIRVINSLYPGMHDICHIEHGSENHANRKRSPAFERARDHLVLWFPEVFSQYT